MKYITLTQGKQAIVDDEDYELLNQHKWCYHKDPRAKTGYAVRNIYKGLDKPKTVRMHVLIMGDVPPGMEVDHKNYDGLDNRRSNLRHVTRSQNNSNKGTYRTNTSGIPGVVWDKSRKQWMVQMVVNGKRKYLGRFKDKELAQKTANQWH